MEYFKIKPEESNKNLKMSNRDDKDYFTDIAVQHLHDSHFKEGITNEQRKDLCLKALELCEEWKIYPIEYNVRPFIRYPDLLTRYLNIPGVIIRPNDAISMLCRCVEQSHEESIKIFLRFLEEQDYGGELDKSSMKLLPGRYTVDEKLYRLCKSHGFSDPNYDDREAPYSHPHMIDSDEQLNYVGYRDAYHLLMHGKSRKIELIEWWEEYRMRQGKFDPDCTFDAACDFYHIQTKYPDAHSVILKKIRDEISQT